MKAFDRYGEYYDLIYQDKDYDGECEFIEEIFQAFSLKPVRTILDLGCGTGGHAIHLAKKGYEITGIDKSEIMIERAREKVNTANLSLDLRVADICQLDLNKKFDTCICMFAVMDYITQTEDVLKTLKNIRRHLNKDSLFVFDCWNGLAVLRTLPLVRVKTIETEGRKIIRTAEPELDAFSHLCRVHYNLLVTQNNTLEDEIEETHVIRYFFPQEIAHYLQDSGFEVLTICPFLDLARRADENVWNITVVAKAI